MNKKVQKHQTRGRPPRTEKQIGEVRDRISACALRLFQEEGYEAVSMRRLAKEANISVMTLYKYFDSKIDILSALWTTVFAQLFDELDHVAASEGDALTRLHSVALGYVTYWMNNPQHYFMIFMSRGFGQADVGDFIQDTKTVQRFDLLRHCLASTLNKETLPEELRLKTEVLLCVLNGIVHNLITISSYPWSSVEDIVRTAIDGLVAS